jgi:AAA domain/Toprim-like
VATIVSAIPENVLALRGWTRKAIERLELGYEGGRVLFPVRDQSGELLGFDRYSPNGAEPKMKADAGTTKELFPPPETIGPEEGDGWIWLVEGQPDGVLAWSLGLLAVAVPGAALWRTEWAPRFSGRRVAVCFDADEPGRKGAARAAADLAAAGIDARLIDLTPFADHDGFDLTNFAAKARTIEERDEARRLLVQIAQDAPLAVPAAEDDAVGPDSITASAAHTWHPLDLIELGSAPPDPPEIGGLLYRGRRIVISGEDDCGKTMLMLAISADELRAGHGVVWIDTDDMGPSMVLERLRAFGVDDATTRHLFAYLRPEEALTDPARDDVIALIRERDVRLLVNDVFNSSLALHGYNPKATEEVEAFWQRCVAPFCRADAAAVLTDHVVKLREARGRYAYGSERKATGCDLHLGLRVIEPFGRGRRGRARITVNRDRVGFLEKPSTGLFVLDSDEQTGRLAWTIEAGHERDQEGEFRPTGYMEKVSDYLERFGGPASRKQIETDVEGKAKHIRAAIDVLVREEFAVEVPGERNARMVKHFRPFREADEWAET